MHGGKEHSKQSATLRTYELAHCSLGEGDGHKSGLDQSLFELSAALHSPQHLLSMNYDHI
jgi:hypothetical protein